MKKTLNETTIRKFMKLANIEGLSENFVEKNVDEGHCSKRDDEAHEEEDVTEGDMGAAYNRDEDEMAMEEVPPEEDEMGMEEAPPEGDEMGDVAPETVEAIVDAIADALESVTGVEINVDSTGGGEEVEMDAELDTGDESGEEELMGAADDAVEMSSDEEDLEEGWDEIAEALEEADVSMDEELNEEDFLNEVTKRVAKRLLKLSKKA